MCVDGCVLAEDEGHMIYCDECEKWFHLKCVDVEEYQIFDIDTYTCPQCFFISGKPSLQKQHRNWNRYDYADPAGEEKQTQIGTRTFVLELVKRKFKPVDSSVVEFLNNGSELSVKHMEKSLFRQPILVERFGGLGLRVPESTFSVCDVERLVGGERIVDVIDVNRQQSYTMKFRKFVQLFLAGDNTRPYNLISLEVSKLQMNELIEVPDIVNEMSWVKKYWPNDTCIEDDPNAPSLFRPEVAKFCLISMANSYTDFHVDFGGTSVWYHVIWGTKLFYIIEPTEKNLSHYAEWLNSANHSERFLADEIPDVRELRVHPGQTVFIPSGWIHAVLTPCDTMVIGGNFLHNLSIKMQLSIFNMEKRLATDEKYMFPSFELMNFYAATHITEQLKELNDEKRKAPGYLKEGARELQSFLKTWMDDQKIRCKRPVSGPLRHAELTYGQLLRRLDKEMKVNDKLQVNSEVVSKASAQPALSKSHKKGHSSTASRLKVKVKKPVVPACLPSTSSQTVACRQQYSVKEEKLKKKHKNLSDSSRSQASISPDNRSGPIKLKLKTKSELQPTRNVEKTEGPVLKPVKLKLFNKPKPSTAKLKLLVRQPIKEMQENSDLKILPTLMPPNSTTNNSGSLTITTQNSNGCFSLDLSLPSTTSPVSKGNVEEVTTPPLIKIETPEILSCSPTSTFVHQTAEPVLDTSGSETSDNKGNRLGFSLLGLGQSPVALQRRPSSEVEQPVVTVNEKPLISLLKSDLFFSSEEDGSPVTGPFISLGSQDHVSSFGRTQKMKPWATACLSPSTSDLSPDCEMIVGKCRADNEFIYPNLIDSESEMDSPPKSANDVNKKEDKAWIPHSKELSATHAPTPGVKRSVEGVVSYKKNTGAFKKAKLQTTQSSDVKAKIENNVTDQKDTNAAATTTGVAAVKPNGPFTTVKKAGAKKGQATAKQRLASKLKINRVRHI